MSVCIVPFEVDKSPFKDSTVEEDQSVAAAVVCFAREDLRGKARPIIFPPKRGRESDRHIDSPFVHDYAI